MKLMNAIALGIEILTDIEQLVAGNGTSFTFTFHGRKFSVNVMSS